MPCVEPTSAGESRPLYDSFAWAYDLVVAHPAGGDANGVARRMRSLGVPSDALVIDAGCGSLLSSRRSALFQRLEAMCYRVTHNGGYALNTCHQDGRSS